MSKRKTGPLTNVSLPIFVRDTTSTTGAGLAGVTHSSSGLVMEYRRQGQSSWTSITPVAKTLGTYVSGGIVADGALDGSYEFDPPNASMAAGALFVIFRIRGVANMLPVLIEIELDAVNYQNDTNFGLSKLGDIETDTQDIQSRLPSALVSGRMNSSVGAFQAGLVPANFADLVITGDGKIDYVRFVEELGASSLAANDVLDSIVQAVLQGQIDDNDAPGSLAKYIQIIKRANTVVDGEVTNATTPTETSFSTNLTYPTGAFEHAVLLFDSGLVIDQNSPIVTYNNTNGQITLEEPLTSAPVVGNTFIIIPASHVHSIAGIVSALMGQAGSTTSYDAGDVGYVIAQLSSMIQSNGGGGWQYNASSLSLAPTGGGGGGLGTGARTVTITVNLSGSPVEGARVRLTKAAESYIGVTNASGQIVFNVDDGSWVVAITASNATFAGAVLAVASNASQSYSITAITITPSSPGNVTGYWLVLGSNGLPESGVTMSMQAASVEHGIDGLALDTATRTATSDALGVAQFSNLTPGVRYQAWRGTGAKVYVTIPLDADDTLELNSLLGSP